MSNILENILVDTFKSRAFFSREELFEFYRNLEPKLKEGTFAWRIYDLKKKNIIKSLKRGLYVITNKPKYKPVISANIQKIAKQITGKFKEINYCIWETDWLNEFGQHQANKSVTIIEIEKGFEESLFYELKDANHNEVFLNPDEKVIELYVAESDQAVIIKKLLTRAPLSKHTEKKALFFTPTLEKILVDLFADNKLFYYLQGSELIHIYEHALTNYTINFTKLLGYAKRREREHEIKQFVKNHLPHLVKNLIDD